MYFKFIIICYFVASAVCDDDGNITAMLDLTHTLNVTAPLLSTNGPLQYQEYSLDAETDMGTHLIPPCFYNKSNWCIPDIPLTNLFVPAVIIDARAWVSNNDTARITLDQLKIWENKYGKIPNGSVVLILTGWSEFWNDTKTYKGTESNNSADYKFPDLEEDAASWLVNDKGVFGVGIDSLSLERGNNGTVHSILANANAYALENLCNLEKLDPFDTRLVVMPIKIDKVKLAPCRVVAMAPNNTIYPRPAPTTTTTTTIAPTTITSSTTLSSTIRTSTKSNNDKGSTDASHQKKKENGKGTGAQTISSVILLITSVLCYIANYVRI